MPMGVLEVMEPDFILPLAEIGPVVAGLVQGDIAPRKRTSMPDKQPQEHGHPALPENPEALGAPSAFTCPDCSGTLWELRDGDLLRYVCRVGHGYSTASIIEAEDDTVERALWAAVRTLEESAALSRRIGQNTQVLRKDMLKKASEREHYAAVIRELLLKQSS
jgi:two-component system chemotaxis response regulator CheB